MPARTFCVAKQHSLAPPARLQPTHSHSHAPTPRKDEWSAQRTMHSLKCVGAAGRLDPCLSPHTSHAGHPPMHPMLTELFTSQFIHAPSKKKKVKTCRCLPPPAASSHTTCSYGYQNLRRTCTQQLSSLQQRLPVPTATSIMLYELLLLFRICRWARKAIPTSSLRVSGVTAASSQANICSPTL